MEMDELFPAMECEPVQLSNSLHLRHGHQHRGGQRYQTGRIGTLMNYAPCSLPTDTVASYYHSYSGQRNCTGLMGSQENTTEKLQAASSSSNNQTDREDSPMVGVCVQQSPVAIH